VDFALELEVTVSQLLLFSVKVSELHGRNRLRFSPFNLFRRRFCLRSFAFTFLKCRLIIILYVASVIIPVEEKTSAEAQ
jgi:hypothetical protein